MKQTLVNSNGNSYTQEIKGRDIKSILERILAQTTQHLNDEDDIYDDEKTQLTQLVSAIGSGDITDDNFEDFLQLWFPEVLSDDAGRKTVSLTVYDDGSRSFKCFTPSGYYDIYEY